MTVQLDAYSVAALVIVVLGIAWSVYYEHFAR